jgi:hypothetical protein
MVFGMVPGLARAPGLGLTTRGGITTVVDTLYTKPSNGTINSVSALSVLKMYLVSILSQLPGSALQSAYNVSGNKNNSSSGASSQASSGTGGSSISGGSSGSGAWGTAHTACGSLCR